MLEMNELAPRLAARSATTVLQPGSLEVTATGFTPPNPIALKTKTLHMLPLPSTFISGCRRKIP